MSYINPTQAAIDKLIADSSAINTPIRMVNLLKFRPVADYGDAPDPAGDDGPSTGAQAYGRYGEIAMAEILSLGGSVFSYAAADMTVIGPEDEAWDVVAIIDYPSRAAFFEMIGRPSYQAGVHHREAGLADTRLIMTTPA